MEIIKATCIKSSPALYIKAGQEYTFEVKGSCYIEQNTRIAYSNTMFVEHFDRRTDVITKVAFALSEIHEKSENLHRKMLREEQVFRAELEDALVKNLRGEDRILHYNEYMQRNGMEEYMFEANPFD